MSRIVMIVDNGVRGDSRVIKTAQSVGLAGHEAIVIGRVLDNSLPTEFTLRGGARVQLVPTSLTLLRSLKRTPRRSILHPLAYPTFEVRTVRASRLDARKAMHSELWSRRAIDRGVSTPRLALSKARLTVNRVWFRLRDSQFKKLTRMRSGDHGRIHGLVARAKIALNPAYGWRSLDPLLTDYELEYGPVIDALEPDLIHAHDFRMSGVGVRAAERALAAGRSCAVVYDAHEFMPGVRAKSDVWRRANRAHEHTYIIRADRVVTVSAQLADLLQTTHSLALTPNVVLNAPEAESVIAVEGQGIRAVLELADDIPLVVYHGSPAKQRGLETVVRALADLPGYHAVFVLPQAAESALYLNDAIDEVGVRDRVHFLPYVPHDQVVDFLRSADVGVIPIEHDVNHEIALITKFFDYALAGLPIVVSDVKAMSEAVEDNHIGTVFPAGDAPAAARALRDAYDNRARYAEGYTAELLQGWTWEQQAETLLATYREAAPWLT
ncbi:MAG: glycosyltransferase [Actinomycetes bacterium]